MSSCLMFQDDVHQYMTIYQDTSDNLDESVYSHARTHHQNTDTHAKYDDLQLPILVDMTELMYCGLNIKIKPINM